MLVNDVSLRAVQAIELGKQFGFTRSKPASVFTPVCVTLDELGSAWRDTRLHLPIRCSINGKLFGDPDAGEAVHGFDKMISYCAMTQTLSPGTIVGGGTVSNQDLKRGFATIAEARSVEEAAGGEAKTPFLKWGDRVRVEMLDAQGRSRSSAPSTTRWPSPYVGLGVLNGHRFCPAEVRRQQKTHHPLSP